MKKGAVDLSELVMELNMQFNDCIAYMRTDNHEIVQIQNYYMHLAEETGDKDNFLDYSDFEREELLQCVDILERPDRYIRIPTKNAIDEHEIMKRFCEKLPEEIGQSFIEVIEGQGNFLQFKAFIKQFGIEEQWYKFYNEALEAFAIQWCHSNHITFTK